MKELCVCVYITAPIDDGLTIGAGQPGLPRAKPGGLFVSLALYALTIKSLIAEWDGRARTGGVSQRDDRGLSDRSAAD